MADDVITCAAAAADLPTRVTQYQSPNQSPISAASAEEMFSKAIALTLETQPDRRLELFERLLQEIVTIVSANPDMRPWKYDQHAGSDGSRIFSGGIGLSLVVDTEGRLWRGRTYEDFETRYKITGTSCEVESMTPKYQQMREYKRL